MQADAETVTIVGRHSIVTFYVSFGNQGGLKLNGIRVKGWPDDDAVERVLDAWNIPKVREVYREKIKWLSENPGFKTPLKKKAPQKRVYASQVE